jgi:hypothetical protein
VTCDISCRFIVYPTTFASNKKVLLPLLLLLLLLLHFS